MKKSRLYSVACVCLAVVGLCAEASGNKDALTADDFYDNGAPDPAKVELGRNLFFDKILSGNENMACATCHHALTDTGDGLSLPIGEGARGLGITRDTGTGTDAVHERVPRNAPHIFNLGAREFTLMFHDGRIQIDESQPSGFLNPAGDDLPLGLDNPLAVQAMFPVQSATEMAGQAGENPQADAAVAGNLAGPGGVWEQLADKLQAVPEYVDMFIAAYPDVTLAADITYVHAANAIAAFEAKNWRFDNSPYDRYLRGDKKAMTRAAKRGMRIFNGKGKCASCHTGVLQSDHQFHAIAMPQIGPGKGNNLPGYTDGRDDFGRERVTGDPADRFRFRTLPLRNVSLTAPYGHSGAYNSLEAVVRHHLDPVNSLYNYDQSQAVLPSRADLDAKDFVVMNDMARISVIADANELEPVNLKEKNIANLLEFLHALTDPAAIDLRGDVPANSPSGLPLAD
ncbi:MAG: cytochrome-c peroxidase [Xanthomonadales bacterium]|nr:cytochrome-c peroxidase [Xanthomonadales bacterium]